jgi:rare lipoprotein A (peptidoglycan hydrolase)
MPLRRTIGISLALLMVSAGAMAKTAETSASYHPASPADPQPQKSGTRPGKARALHRVGHPRIAMREASHRGRQARYQRVAPQHLAGAGGGLFNPDWGAMHPAGTPEIGQAAWYGLIGNRTSSGEPLDTVTLTAAHRSLPLGSCAKVVSLDTGRSVIVRINDRGPYNRRFIIDLSPRAADELGMRQAGVAAVAVEPLAFGAAADAAKPTLAIYRGPGVSTTY